MLATMANFKVIVAVSMPKSLAHFKMGQLI
jgi:hypothetical protein